MGWVEVACDVTSSGRPENCSVVEEHPVGRELGAQAVEIVQRGRLSRRTVAEAKPGARFKVTVQLELERESD